MPTFSILLPSRDRLDLLKLAIRSVLEQDFDGFEVVVSDNASSEHYSQYIHSLKDPRIKYMRSEELQSVTDNWNMALRAATGDYVLMLGDDDALTPGLLQLLDTLIQQYEHPDVIYMMAYHYLYPDVAPEVPLGSLAAVANSELFVRHDRPYWLASEEGIDLARKAVSFQHMVSFNAQHFLWRRDFAQTAADFFQPPYPDYFACFYTFLKAERILILPTPSIIIGISKKSFGFFFINNKQDEGNSAFGNNAGSQLRQEERQDLLEALSFSGPVHYRNWLLTSLRFQTNVAPSFTIDTDRYRRIQIVETLAEALINDPTVLKVDKEDWLPFETFVSEIWTSLQKAIGGPTVDTTGGINQEKMRKLQNMGVYFPASVRQLELGEHRDIMDAFGYLRSISSPEIAVDVPPLRSMAPASFASVRRIISSVMNRLRR